jgi:ABC-type transporter Mla subunit MlaD
MTRRRQGSIAANPVLVGAVTVLVTVVAVFLAYNANSGLPFVPSYEVEVSLPDANRLVEGNEVRVGGRRVGIVQRLRPRVSADGRVTAVASLKLEASLRPLSADTGVLVRAKSPLGLKYVELVPGRGPQVNSPRLDRSRQAQPVELDDLLDTFDAPTRRATQDVLASLGSGFAGRGPDLNLALGSLSPAFRDLAPVMAALAAPSTDLDGFIAGMASAARATAPVAASLRRTFGHLDRTLDAVAAEAPSLRAILEELPATEVVGTRAFVAAAPVLARASRLLREIAPATPALRPASAALARTVGTAPPDLRSLRELATGLTPAFTDVRRLALRPSTIGAVRRLTPVVTELGDALPEVIPVQTVCNYIGLWMRNVNSGTSEGDRNGHWFRFAPVAAVEEMLQQPAPPSNLHVMPYPNMTPGDCEAGNEPYLPGRQLGNLPGAQGPTETTTRRAEVQGR